MNSIYFSLIQTDIYWEDEAKNIEKYNLLLQQIPNETEIVILPEMFATGFTMNVNKLLKPTGEMVFEWLQEKSKELHKIIVGSVLIKEKGNFYNRMYWMRPDGTYEYYDKRHLFHMGGEHQVMTAGDKKTIVEYKNTRFLLQICYDLRFPVWARNSYNIDKNEYAYDVLIYIANWPKIRKQAYSALLKARAIENQSYVIWVNRVGEDANNMEHSGNTKLLNAHGQMLFEATENIEEIVNFTINLDELKMYRNSFKLGLDWDTFLE